MTLEEEEGLCSCQASSHRKVGTSQAAPPAQGLWRCTLCVDTCLSPSKQDRSRSLAAHPGAKAAELTGAGNKTQTQVSWLSYSGFSLTCFLLPVCKQHDMGLQRLEGKTFGDGETKESSMKR